MDNGLINIAVEYFQKNFIEYELKDFGKGVLCFNYKFDCQRFAYTGNLVIEPNKFFFLIFPQIEIPLEFRNEILKFVFAINRNDNYRTLVVDVESDCAHFGCRMAGFYDNSIDADVFNKYFEKMHGAVDFYTGHVRKIIGKQDIK